MEIEAKAIKKQRIDRVGLLTLRDPIRRMPAFLSLDVEGVRFSISVQEEDEVRSMGKIQSPDSRHRETGTPELSEAFDVESDRRISGGFLGDFDSVLKFHTQNKGDDFDGQMITRPLEKNNRKEDDVITASNKIPKASEKDLESCHTQVGEQKFSSFPSLKRYFWKIVQRPKYPRSV